MAERCSGRCVHGTSTRFGVPTRAASAAVSGADRAGMSFEARLSGFEPDLLGGAGVILTGLRPELNGEWHLASVTHDLSTGGLVTSFRAEKGEGKK